jgi:hypothetical protein
MTFLRYFLWLVPHILIAAVLVGLFRRGLQRQLPFFAAYLFWELAQFLALFTINWLPAVSTHHYHWGLVVALAGSVVLKFGVIHELTRELFLSQTLVSRILRPLLRWTAAALLLVAAAVSATFATGGMQRVEALFHSLNFSSAVIQSGLLLGLFLFTRALHISWRSSITGVALGFGMFAAIGLTTSAFHPMSGSNKSIALDLIQMTAYLLCVLVWTGYLLLPEPVSVLNSTNLQKSDLELWDQELQKMVER